MKKKKWLGGLLNFILPGLGNFYGRNYKKGILIYFLFLLVVFSLKYVAYTFQLFFTWVILVASYYLFSIILGFRDVDRNKEYQSSRFDKWYIYILILVFHFATMSLIKDRTYNTIAPINFARIPTPAMEPALQIGDILAFNKTKVIIRNDVSIFWHPDDIKTMYVKRCVGLPGDSLQISNGRVLINMVPAQEFHFKFKYLVTTDGSKINPRVLEKLNLNNEDYYESSPDTYQFFLTEEQVNLIKELKFVKSIELSIRNEGESETSIYPKSESHHWNTDFYGPIYIPRKGDKIEINDKTMDLYMKCIEYENDSVKYDISGLKVNGQSVTSYSFKENYFFMMGDNRHNSLDSRYWGFLPERLIIGKALYTYWSASSERIGKKII